LTVESSRGRRRTEDRVRERLGRPHSYSVSDSSLAKRSFSAHRNFLRTLLWRPERLPNRVASLAHRFGDVDSFPLILLLLVSVRLIVRVSRCALDVIDGRRFVTVSSSVNS